MIDERDLFREILGRHAVTGRPDVLFPRSWPGRATVTCALSQLISALEASAAGTCEPVLLQYTPRRAGQGHRHHRRPRQRQEHARSARSLRELRTRGARVAIVAVDPSSPLTGGAILGDRHPDEGSTARTTCTSGRCRPAVRSAALSRATADVVAALDASGLGHGHRGDGRGRPGRGRHHAARRTRSSSSRCPASATTSRR